VGGVKVAARPEHKGKLIVVILPDAGRPLSLVDPVPRTSRSRTGVGSSEARDAVAGVVASRGRVVH